MEEKNIPQNETSNKLRKEIENLKLTPEEKEIINYLDKGYKERKIADILHKHKDTIYGRIREINRKKVALAQILRTYQRQESKTKDEEDAINLLIKEGVITKEQIEQNSKIDKIKPIILDAIKNRLSIEEIAEENALKDSEIKNVINILVKEGAITNKEIKKWEEDIKIITYYDKGYSIRKIANLLSIPPSSTFDRVNKLKTEGLISKEKLEEQTQSIEICIEKIIEKCKEYNLKESDIDNILNVLVKQNEITNKEIKKWEEYIEIISYLYAGYSVKKIAKIMRTGDKTIAEKRDKLIEEGITSKEKIEEYRQLIKIKESLQLTQEQKVLLSYLDNGYKIKDIAKALHKDIEIIYKKIQAIRKKQKKIQIKDDIRAEIMKGRFIEDIIEQFKKTEFGKSDIKDIITLLSEEDLLVKKQIEYIIERKKYEELKRETYEEVNFGKKPTYKKDEQIREYIDLCNKVYMNSKIPKQELQHLKQAIQIVSTINKKDVINFIKHCIKIEEYEEAISIFTNKQIMQKLSISEETKQKLQNTLKTAYQIQQAKQLINKGNTNTEVISEVTGLPQEKVSILKIQLEGKEIKLLDVNKREQVINWLLQDKIAGVIQAKFGITDFEMKDIEQQASQRRFIKNDKQIDLETKARQSSALRIIVLYKKLGKSTDYISEILDIDINIVQRYIKAALKWQVIKKDEIDGIKLLDDLDQNLETLEI